MTMARSSKVEVRFTAGHNGLSLLVLLGHLVKGLRDRLEHTRYSSGRHANGVRSSVGAVSACQAIWQVRTAGRLAGGGHAT